MPIFGFASEALFWLDVRCVICDCFFVLRLPCGHGDPVSWLRMKRDKETSNYTTGMNWGEALIACETGKTALKVESQIKNQNRA